MTKRKQAPSPASPEISETPEAEAQAQVSRPDPLVEEATVDVFRQDLENANEGTDRGKAILKASIQRHGAGRSILVDKNNRIIAGNKTQVAADEVGLRDVLIVETDGSQLVAVRRTDLDLATDPAARQIAYEDNLASEFGLSWNVDQVHKDWEAGRLPEGGWNRHELGMMFDGWGDDQEGPDNLDEVPEELPGAAALKVGMIFSSDEAYNIPALLPELLGELPEELDVWAGRDAADPEYDGWYLYSYGTDSMRGLDLSRAILAFYTDDYRFENWFQTPDIYVAKMINAGLSIAVSPNFSLWYGDPQAFHIFNTYRSRYLARYMQEAGIAIIPDVNWADMGSFTFCLAGIPLGAPCVSIQIQTVSAKEERDRLCAGIKRSIEELRPDSLILYGGGQETRAEVVKVLPDSLHVVWVESRASRRNVRVMAPARATN